MPLSKLWAGSLVLLAAVSLPLQAASPVKVGSKIDTEGALPSKPLALMRRWLTALTARSRRWGCKP